MQNNGKMESVEEKKYGERKKIWKRKGVVYVSFQYCFFPPGLLLGLSAYLTPLFLLAFSFSYRG